MPTLLNRNGTFAVKFGYKTKQYVRTLATKEKTYADICVNALVRRLYLLKTGAIELQDGLDIGDFLAYGTNHEHAPHNSPFLDAFIDEYLDSIKPPRKSESTVITEKTHLNHLFEAVGNVKVSTIKASDIEKFINERIKIVSTDTVNKEIVTFRQFFAFAVSHCLFRNNIMDGIKRFRSQSSGHRFMTQEEIASALNGSATEETKHELLRWRYLSVEETRRLLDHFKMTRIELFVCVLAATGMRFGELFKLKWTDIDMNAKILWAKSSKQSRSVMEKSRDIDLPDELIQLLMNKRLTSTSEYVFNELSAQAVRRTWNNVLRGTEFDGIGFHCLRHSFCSNLAAAGVDERVVEHLMGHSSGAMRSRYQHLFPKNRRQASSVMKIF